MPPKIVLSGHGLLVQTGDADFRQLEFRYPHIAIVKEFTELRHNIPVSIAALAKAFECRRIRI
jgi:hypothetical protein